MQSRAALSSGKRKGLPLDPLAQLSAQAVAGHKVDADVEEVFQGQLEIHELLEAGTRWEINQKVEITVRLCATVSYRSEDAQFSEV